MPGPKESRLMNPDQLQLHGSVLGTSKGTWLLDVVDIRKYGADGRTAVLFHLRPKDPPGPRRKLTLIVPASAVKSPLECASCAGHIRSWIESCEGDGMLEPAAATLGT